MNRGNGKKLREVINIVVDQLKNSRLTLTSLRKKFHVSPETLKREILAVIPEDEYISIAKVKLAQNLELHRWNSKRDGLRGIVAYKYRTVGTISVKIRHRKYGPNKEFMQVTKVPYIKIGEYGTREQRWMRLATYNWIRVNKKSVPAGFYVVSKNGDTMDCRPDNLILSNRNTHILLTQQNFAGMSARGAASLHIKIKNNPLLKKRAIENRSKTCRIRRMKKALVLRKIQGEVEILQKHKAKRIREIAFEIERERAVEAEKTLIYGPQFTRWDCFGCGAEYHQEQTPEQCGKCGDHSFERNIYRRKTG
ncbi:MAG: hypothetical protein MUP16_09980 [Sedimentisphaerales bacterium]|nr:hypothetical protein [Sedimentisphaerales bacterium]